MELRLILYTNLVQQEQEEVNKLISDVKRITGIKSVAPYWFDEDLAHSPRR